MARKKTSKPAAKPAAKTTDKTADEPKNLALPVSVIGPADVGRLTRELESVDDNLLQLGLRKGGAETQMPKTSQLMDQIVHVNKLNLLKQPERAALLKFLAGVKERSPVMHISFSADPPPLFLEKLTAWLRREIHPSVLLTVGIQPNIGAGCIVRTTNKQFDFSLRQDFAKKRDLLLQQVSPPAGPAPANPEPVITGEAPSW